MLSPINIDASTTRSGPSPAMLSKGPPPGGGKAKTIVPAEPRCEQTEGSAVGPQWGERTNGPKAVVENNDRGVVVVSCPCFVKEREDAKMESSSVVVIWGGGCDDNDYYDGNNDLSV